MSYPHFKMTWKYDGDCRNVAKVYVNKPSAESLPLMFTSKASRTEIYFVIEMHWQP